MPEQSQSNFGCGVCGYSVEGLSVLQCPECGADLREVGITAGNKTRERFIRIAIMLGYTAAVVACALLTQRVVEPMLPVYQDRYYSIQVQPLSGEYQELGFHIGAELVQPASASPSTNVMVGPGSGPMTTVTMCDPGSQITVTDVDIVFRARQINDGVPINAGTNIGIDPVTLKASWVDALGQNQQSSGAFTPQDLLDCFESHKVDVQRADVQLEAKQVHAFVTEFIGGKHQLTLSAFNTFAYGGGATDSHGPPWFMYTSISVWIVVWGIGFILIIRRGRKKA